MRWILVLVGLAACGGGKESSGSGSGSGSGSAAPVAPAITVRFGDCAGPTATWVSGPRPLPFTVEQAAGVWKPEEMPVQDDPPPAADEPVRAPDEDNGVDAFGAVVGDPLARPSPFGRGFGYGTIGHGAGISYGYGRRRPDVPSVSLGTPEANGDLDKAIIRRYIKRNISKITYCYEKQLLVTPAIKGTMTVQFFIAPEGTVASSNATGVDPEVAKCVAGVIKDIEFPKPKGGGGVQVNYPFEFRPSPDASIAPVEAPGSGSGSGSAIPAPPAIPRDLFRTADHARRDPASYQAGATNPLRAQEAALTACVTPAKDGAFVVGLTYDASGAVTAATVDGLDQPDVTACVVAAAKLVTRAGAGPTGERCAVAFGDRSSDAFAIDVGSNVKLAGKEVAIPELGGVIEAARVTALAPTGPPVVAHPPIVIRPADDASLATVLRVMVAVGTAGDDFVLAAKRGSEWKPLRALASPFPLVPVPTGTGGTWKPVVGHGGGAARIRPIVTIVVGADRYIRMMVENGAEGLEDFAPGPDQAAKAAAGMKPLQAYAKHAIVEISGEPDAPYGTLVTAVDAAVAAGFTEWRIAAP